MAIRPICDRCKTELQDYGAILLSPPTKRGTVNKLHVCKDCYKKIIREFSKQATA